jgi:hypothetical protein
MAATTCVTEPSESKKSQECWKEVFTKIENEQMQSFGDSQNNNNNSNVSTGVFPCDFASLCRVVNDLNSGFSLLRDQLESVVENLDTVSKTNYRIHDKVHYFYRHIYFVFGD